LIEYVIDSIQSFLIYLFLFLLQFGTPLDGASFNGHIEIVKYLIEKGAEVELSREVDLWI
jgi:ankyrin repeat protein